MKAIMLIGCKVIFFFFLQDLKDDTLKAEMGAARSVLEKSTMMLLTTSKVFSVTKNCPETLSSVQL